MAITSHDAIVTENQVRIISVLLLSALFMSCKRLVKVYKFDVHGACREEGMGSSRAMLATVRPSCYRLS